MNVHAWAILGPMGVGAVFISTLGLSRLPAPNNPPENQAELLAATLQPIVAFVVLGSILIRKSPLIVGQCLWTAQTPHLDGLSIPAFWFGRKIHTRTFLTLSASGTWSRTWTNRNQNNVPDWVLSTRRVSPTQDEQLQSRTIPDSEIEGGTIQIYREDDKKYDAASEKERRRSPEGVVDDRLVGTIFSLMCINYSGTRVYHCQVIRDEIMSKKESKLPAHSNLDFQNDVTAAERSDQLTPEDRGDVGQSNRPAFAGYVNDDLDNTPPGGLDTQKQVQFAQ